MTAGIADLQAQIEKKAEQRDLEELKASKGS